MRSTVFLLLLIATVCCSCGSGSEKDDRDSTGFDSVHPGIVAGQPDFKITYNNLWAQLQVQKTPVIIDVDSAYASDIALKNSEAGVLFPAGFGIPEEVLVTAIGKQEMDSITVIWYRMNVAGTDNKDVWAVLYNKTGAIQSHLAATRGNGYGYAKMDSLISLREVFIEKSGKTAVTTKVTKVENGRFVSSDEKTSTFEAGQEAQSQALVEDYLK